MNGIAACTPEYLKAYIWSLVLHAAGIDHLMVHRESNWYLMVAEEFVEAASLEIAAYETENRNWPPAPEAPDHDSLKSPPPTVLLMGALLVFYQITGPWSAGSKWFQAGAVNTTRIITDNEWWRVITGLTLHADIVHVLGNVVIGGVLVHYLLKVLGTGTGTALVLCTGAIGNAINVVMRGHGHLSVGFSTAVFGAVGILSGLRVRTGNYKHLVLPFGAGLGLLAMLGAEGERADLGAHLWGLVAGLLFGLLWARRRKLRQKKATLKTQMLLFSVSMTIVMVSWWLALSS